jgi:hypothetical protein
VARAHAARIIHTSWPRTVYVAEVGSAGEAVASHAWHHRPDYSPRADTATGGTSRTVEAAFVPFGNIAVFAASPAVVVAGVTLLAVHVLTLLEAAFLIVGGLGLGASAMAALINMRRSSAG